MSGINVRLDIEYDGTAYAGWARQPGLPTIEAAILTALEQILQQPVSLAVAGRTDAGVHARGQVANFHSSRELDPSRLRRSANQLLPDDIVITKADEAPEGFDARRSALSRGYSYHVLNRPFPSAFRYRFTYFYPGYLDRRALDDAAVMLAGRHDFTAFTPAVSEHVHFEREIIESAWSYQEDSLVFHIRAQSFLRNMVRVLVGTMLEVARGYRDIASLPALLSGASRSEAGKTAPAQGLFLESVEY